MGTLNEDEQKKVVWGEGRKWFKFGGGELLKSLKTVEFPCTLGGKKIQLHSDVVSSDIPLLISKTAMKNAGGVLDLVNDRVQFFGKWQVCECTSSGHYMVSLGTEEVTVDDILLTLNGNEADVEKNMLKLHRQFGHPTRERFVKFIKVAGHWNPAYNSTIDALYSRCRICKLFSKTPSRPVCALPVSSDFNEVLTLDLKEFALKPNIKYILHMIDAFTRFSLSAFLTRKKPEMVVDNVLTKWVGTFGRPKKIWTDLGGEFNAEEMREMSEAFGVELGTAAGMAPWMNGLCERNHQIIDFSLEKILYDNPRMSPEIALVWACNAKNALCMNNGFSSSQLVLGSNPQLPSAYSDKLPALEGTTTSEAVANHIKAIYEARRAFVESESSERIRRALRHKVRSVERDYQLGQWVYYKRDGKGNRWHGPAKVIGKDGSTIFIKHQNSFLRVASCRLQPTEEEMLKDVGLGNNDCCGSSTGEYTSAATETRGSSNDNVKEYISGSKSKVDEVGEQEVSQNLTDNREPSVVAGEIGEQEVSQNLTDNREPSVVSGDVSVGTSKQNSGLQFLKVPQKGDTICYKIKNGDGWDQGVVIGRGGKQSGANKYWINVQPKNGEPFCLNLQKKILLLPCQFHVDCIKKSL